MQNHHFGHLLFVLTTFCVIVLGENLDHCYANNTNPYIKFGTKTPYKLVYGHPAPPFTQEGCTPILLWSVIRHGTRNPFYNELASLRQLKKLRDQILRNEELFKNVDLCLEDLKNLKSWKFNIHGNETSLLTEQGLGEMYSLGQRVKERFSQIFQAGYSPEKFVFQTTDSKRSQQSAEAFLQGLFLLHDTENMTSVNNSLLKGFKNCTMWKLKFGTNPEISRVLSHFSKMKVMMELVQNVSSRLGSFFVLQPREVSSMYQMCRYDKAFNQTPTYVSPWCAMFTEEELKILEFKEDLYYYYKHGYGMSINLKLGCPLVQDMIIKFNEAVDKTEAETKSVVYFTNHGMFERLLARLGFFNDTKPLTGKNVTSRERRWRTSNVPFGANLLVILYKCTTESSPQNYKVVFYLNENILQVEGCDNGVCLWDTIKNRFTNITNVETCNLNDCYVGSGVAMTRQTTFYIYVILFALVTFVFLKAT